MAINTTITDVNEFLNHIVTSTNMKCLTPPSALSGSCGFLAANLYAKSVFGEDALVNLSVEKGADGKLSGYIRIRSAALLFVATQSLSVIQQIALLYRCSQPYNHSILKEIQHPRWGVKEIQPLLQVTSLPLWSFGP